MLNEQPNKEKVLQNIYKFMESYLKLGPTSKKAFEKQLMSSINKMDNKTRELYMSLLKSAKDNRSKEEAFTEMERIWDSV